MALDKLTKLTSNSGISTVIDYTMSDLIVDSINIAGGGTTLGKDFETRNLKVTGLSTFVGNVQMDGNLTVNGTTTTLDTNLIGVDRVEVVANDNNYAGIAVTQSGTVDIISAYDGSTQVFVVSDGNKVGIADSIYHLGDDNTAFGFPSADTFKIDTAGTERLRITGIGSVGINEDEPKALLHVATDNGQTLPIISSSFPLIVTKDSNSGIAIIAKNDAKSILAFGDTNAADRGKIQYTHTSGSDIDSMQFLTAGSEKLRITDTNSGGNVQVSGGDVHLDANGELAVFETNTSLAFTNSSKLCFDFSSNVARIRSSINGSATARPLAFYIGTNESYRITASGTNVFGGNAAAPIVDNGELLYRGNTTQTFESLPQSFYLYGDTLGSNSANTGTGMVFGGKYKTDGSITTFAGIHGIRTTTTNNSYPGALVFGTRTDGGGAWEKMRITSTGTVGIGEDDPDGNKLLIRAASTVGTKGGHIMLCGDSATVDEGPQIVFSESGSGSQYAGGSIGFQRKGGNSVGDLIFGTRNASGDANTATSEVLRIQSTAKIYQTCTTDITPNSSWDAQFRIVANGYTGGIGFDGSSMYVGHNSPNRHLNLQTNYTNRLTITKTGNVGINSSIPSSQLVVQATTDDNPAITLFRNSGGGDIASIGWQSAAGNQARINYRGASPAGMQFYTGGTASSNLNMIIDTNGKVGIGTNLPDEILHIGQFGTSGNNYNEGRLKIGGFPGTSYGLLVGYDNRGSGRGNIVNVNDSGGTNNRINIGFGAITTLGVPTTEVVTINQSGKVGIGTNDPAPFGGGASLDVWGDGSAYPTLRLGTEAYQTDGEGIRFGRTDIGSGSNSDIRYHSIHQYHDGVSSGSNYLRFKLHDAGGSPYTSQQSVMTLYGSGKLGLNYDANPPGEDMMIRGIGSAGAITAQHLSGGNSYGCRFASRGSTNSGFKIATQFNSAYNDKIEMDGNGRVIVSTDGQTSSGNANMIFSILCAGNHGSSGIYPGISIRSTAAGASAGAYIWTTDDNWGIKTTCGVAGLAFAPNGNGASSGDTRLYIGSDGKATIGPDTYNRIGSSRDSNTALHVAGGGLSIGPIGNNGATRDGGRYLLGWYMVHPANGYDYMHIVTDLWGGGSPHGNTEYIMGGFHIHGHSYSTSGQSEERIYFHNWNGNLYGHSRGQWGAWNPNNTVYINSSGYVTIRLKMGSSGSRYEGYIIDLIQHAWYGVRNILVTATTSSDSTTL